VPLLIIPDDAVFIGEGIIILEIVIPIIPGSFMIVYYLI